MVARKKSKKAKVKRLPKKSTEKSEQPKVRKLNKTRVGITIAILAALIIAAGFVVYNNFSGLIPKQEPAGEAAAIVNGEEIPLAELNSRYDRLPANYKQTVTKQQLLDNLIDETLLIQKAEQEGVTVSDNDVKTLIQMLLQQNQMTEDELKFRLAQQNVSYDELKEIYRRELMITKLINQSVISKIEITEDEMQEFYENNSDQLILPERINVSHILICHNESLRCDSNLTKDEAEELAEDVRDMVNDTNFGELAAEYSYEPSAVITLGNLGIVSIEDPFDSTFLDASFNLDAEEVSDIVETDFGYHIIKVHEKFPESVVEFEEVETQINQTLTMQKQQEAFTAFLDELRENAEITVLLNE